MDLGVISVRYARALLKCSVESKAEDQVYQEIGLRLNFDELSDRVTLKKGKRWRKPRKP